ncbi:hypothetical protein QTN25_006444 [Entamoeba marina]
MSSADMVYKKFGMEYIIEYINKTNTTHEKPIKTSASYAEKLVEEEMNTIFDDQLRNAPRYYYLKSVIKDTLLKSGLENRNITVNSKN